MLHLLTLPSKLTGSTALHWTMAPRKLVAADKSRHMTIRARSRDVSAMAQILLLCKYLTARVSLVGSSNASARWACRTVLNITFIEYQMTLLPTLLPLLLYKPRTHTVQLMWFCMYITEIVSRVTCTIYSQVAHPWRHRHESIMQCICTYTNNT